MEEEASVAPAPQRARCPNCDFEIDGPYCPSCGQQQKNLNRYIWTLSGELFEEVFHPDSRASRTLFALLFRPGYLTTEYFAGRRMRYVPPLRLYLIISFLFFFILPVISTMSDNMPNQVNIESGDEPGQTWQQELKDGEYELSFPWLTDEENKALSERFDKQLDKTIDQFDDAPGKVIGEFMDVMSAVMFFLLPFFAILLKIFYLGSGVYYAEHLLLTVHNHCFLFLALLISSLLQLAENTVVGPVTATIDAVLNFWMPIYMFISLKHAYSNGYLVTFLKYFILTIGYFILALIGFVTTIVVGIMMA